MLARDIMTRPVISVGTGTSVAEASRLLVDRGFTAAPVVDDDGRLVGIVTEADLLRGRIAPDPRRIPSGPRGTGTGRAASPM